MTRTPPPAITGFAGLSVLTVALQSSGGFAVELLGPDLVLAAGGFIVTSTVLTAGASAWYRDQLGRHAPLLILTLLAGLAAIASLGRAHQVGQAAIDGLGGLLGVQNWVEIARAGALPVPRAELLAPHGDFYTGRLDLVNPFGTLWLVALLVQFTLVWPLVLIGLRSLVNARAGRRMLRLVPFIVALALLSAVVGVLRARWGADPAELAFGSHVRAAEWLAGAAAGAAAAGLPRRPGATAWSMAALGFAGVVASAVAATLWRDTWLTSGGPAAAALSAAVVMLALHLDSSTDSAPDGRLAGLLGRGLPLELGRSAYPILLLHAPLFWLVQRAVPGARPFALIALGLTLAWLVGLLVHDGVLRRVRDARRGVGTGAVLLTVGVLVAGAPILYTLDERPLGAGTGPTVLVLGGSSGADAAAALTDSRFRVIDATRPGCGLLPQPPDSASPARPTALAQAPQSAPDCAGLLGRWRTAVATARPAAVVLDLSADADPRRGPDGQPGPCDPQFRAGYRSLVADAVGVLTAGGPDRPIVVTTLQDGPGQAAGARRRCLDALVVEAATTHRAVVAFDPDRHLCPDGYCRPAGEPGAPRLGDGVHLTGAGIAALAGPLEQRLVAELAGARTPACASGRREGENGC